VLGRLVLLCNDTYRVTLVGNLKRRLGMAGDVMLRTHRILTKNTTIGGT
jgi:hypothetical protein